MADNVAWQIPLQAGQNLPVFGMDPQKMANMALMQQRLQQIAQVQRSENALRSLYANKDNLDASGNPKPEAMRQLMSSAPNAGLELMGDLGKFNEQQLRSGVLGWKIADEKKRYLIDEVTRPSVAAYDEALQKTGDPAQAQQAAQQVYSERLTGVKSSGRLTPADQQPLAPNFDINRAKANITSALTVEQQLTEQDKHNKFTLETDYGHSPPIQYKMFADGRITTLTGGAYTPTGVGETKASSDKLLIAKDSAGKEVKIKQTPGGYVDAGSNKPININDYTNVHNVGTKAESAGGEVTILGDQTKDGSDYLASLPTGERNVVQLMVEGKSPPVSAFAMKSPDMQRMLAEAKQADPTFDQTTWGKRYGVIRSYSSGKDHNDLVSFNTAINHAGALWRSAQELGNFGGVLTPLNPVKDFIQTRTGDPRYKVFRENAIALSEELERAFRGTGGNLTSIQEWRKSLDEAGSPEQIQAAVAKAMELLAGRIGAKRDDYDRSMGPFAKFDQFITPTSKRAIATIPGGNIIAETAGVGSSAPEAASPPSAAAPTAAGPPLSNDGGAPEVTEQQYNALPLGAAYRVPGNPKVMYKR